MRNDIDVPERLKRNTSDDPTGDKLRRKIATCRYSESEDAEAIVSKLLARGFKLIKVEGEPQ